MYIRFFERSVFNSPYVYPSRNWKLDDQGLPIHRIIEKRSQAKIITLVPKPRKQRGSDPRQLRMVADATKGLSTQEQQYDPTSIINRLRTVVDQWRQLPNQNRWQVTPETARLLQRWRHHKFNNIRPFFCQVEAVKTAIWLTKVTPHAGKSAKGFLKHLANANPDIMRLALKLAAGTGKITVMAMLIAWKTINATRRPASRKFTRAFLVVTPGLTIKDRLRVLQPNDSNSYTDNNEESFFVRHAYFLGAKDLYKSPRMTLKAGINEEARDSLHSDISRPFEKPASGRIAVKSINHLGDDVMKVSRVE